jgi:hypothetical protein
MVVFPYTEVPDAVKVGSVFSLRAETDRDARRAAVRVSVDIDRVRRMEVGDCKAQPGANGRLGNDYGYREEARRTGEVRADVEFAILLVNHVLFEPVRETPGMRGSRPRGKGDGCDQHGQCVRRCWHYCHY